MEACIAAELFISFAFKLFDFQSLPPVGAAHLSKPLWSLSCHTYGSHDILWCHDRKVCKSRLHAKPVIWSIFYLHTYHISTISATQPKTQNPFDSNSTPACLRCDFQVVGGLPGQNVALIWWLAATAKLSWSCLKDRFNQKRTWRLKEISLLTYWVVWKKKTIYYSNISHHRASGMPPGRIQYWLCWDDIDPIPSALRLPRL